MIHTKTAILNSFSKEEYENSIELMAEQFRDKDLLYFSWNYIKSTSPMCSYKKVIRELDTLIQQSLIINDVQCNPSFKKQELRKLTYRFSLLEQDYTRKFMIQNVIKLIRSYLNELDKKRLNCRTKTHMLASCIYYTTDLFEDHYKEFALNVYTHLYPKDKKFKLLYIK